MIKWLESISPKDCLFVLNQFEDEVDLFFIYKKPAFKNDFVLVNNIKKISCDIKVILADKVDKTCAKGMHVFVLLYISPENLLDNSFDTGKNGNLKREKKWPIITQ